MSTNLSSWSPFLAETKSSSTFNKFINSIIQLDESDPSHWTKWKNYANQVVIEAPNYYYKLYQNDIQAGEFYCEIREALSQIYKEEFGVHWEIITIKENNSYYQIEQREKLQVCTPELISFEDLLIDWSHTLKKLEKKLGLHIVTLQLKEYINNLNELKLIRDCINKHEDYGFKNGHVILLDDADWFIALTDKDNNWISHSFNAFPVIQNSVDRLFAPQDFYNKDPASATGEIVNKWNIFYNSQKITKNFVPNLLSIREQMISDNIHILCESNTKILTRGERKLCIPKEGEQFWLNYDL